MNTPEGMLFDRSDDERRPPEKLRGTVPRFQQVNRRQRMCLPYCLDDLVPPDHEVRAVWEYVESLDLTPLYAKVRAVEGGPGRSPIDLKILMTLWLYASLKGVGSARELERLCEQHSVYRWICGGVSVNYHTLSEFRTAHESFLDNLLTQSIAALMEEGLVKLERVAQDGMRVRASAGSSSFHRRASLEESLAEAEEQLQRLRAELEAHPGATTARQKAARERAARERAERVKKALERLPELEARKAGDAKEQARASTTDADATTMKMGDGGFRPAFNIEFAAETKTKFITGTDVVMTGSDRGQMAPMAQQHETRYERRPPEMLVDGGFATKEDIVEVAAEGTTVYAPVQKSKDKDRAPHTPRADDKPAVAAWRERMATPEAKAIYQERASTAEWVNAMARNRGMQQFRVRGRAKVRAVVLWFVLAHNLMRALALRAEAAKGAQ
jgi:transposase